MNTISINYRLKWELKTDNKYQWSECGKLFNIKTGREVKKTIVNYSIGYWINRKFMTLNNLKRLLVKIDYSVPF